MGIFGVLLIFAYLLIRSFWICVLIVYSELGASLMIILCNHGDVCPSF